MRRPDWVAHSYLLNWGNNWPLSRTQQVNIARSPHFWYLSEYGQRHTYVVQVGDRNLLTEFFHGPLKTPWEPPPYKIDEKRIWPDWMSFSPPLISKRAVEVLSPHFGDSCELLPWIKEPQHEYWLVNIRAQIPRCSWNSEVLDRHGETISNADNFRISIDHVPPIFMLEGYRGKVFVSDDIAHLSVTNKLAGMCFVDPSIAAMDALFIKKKFGKRRTGFVTNSNASRPPRLH